MYKSFVPEILVVSGVSTQGGNSLGKGVCHGVTAPLTICVCTLSFSPHLSLTQRREIRRLRASGVRELATVECSSELGS